MRTEARRRLYTSDDDVMTDVRTRCLTVCTRWAGYTQATAVAQAAGLILVLPAPYLARTVRHALRHGCSGGWVGGVTCQAILGRARDAASDMSFNHASLDVVSTRSWCCIFWSRHLLMLHPDSAQLSTSSLRHLQPLFPMLRQLSILRHLLS